MRWSVPERRFPCFAGPASPLRLTFGASPRCSSGSSSCLDIWCCASPRFMVLPLSLPFGPSRRKVFRAIPGAMPCPASTAATMASADFSLRLSTSPFQAQGETSPGKRSWLSPHNRRIYAASPWPLELRGQGPTRPGPQRLISGFCSSVHGFATRFLQRRPRGRSPCGSLGVAAACFPRGLSPPSHAPCRAHPTPAWTDRAARFPTLPTGPNTGWGTHKKVSPMSPV